MTDSNERASVAVVISTFNHAHFLSEALDSVMAQTRPVDEIVVVDDGSQDDPAAIVARYPGVRLIRPRVIVGWRRSKPPASPFSMLTTSLLRQL